ncbi:MAG: alpha/beta fold hydrolase, partial [Egibacteraceae bacterium]
MHFIDRQGVRLAYYDPGRAGRTPMLLVHGWCSNAAIFEPLAAAFRADYRVVSVDLRGNGASDAPEGADHYTVTTSADDLATLCDHLGLRGAVLVAHSLGGAAATELAARRPDLAAAVVTLDGAVRYPDEDRPQAAELVAGLAQSGRVDSVQA